MGRSTSSAAAVSAASAGRPSFFSVVSSGFDLACCAPDAIELCASSGGASASSSTIPPMRQRSEGEDFLPSSPMPERSCATPESAVALAAARGLTIPKQHGKKEFPPQGLPEGGKPTSSSLHRSLPTALSAAERRSVGRSEEELAIRRMNEERRLTALRFLRCGQARVPSTSAINLVVKLMYKYHNVAEIQSSGALALASIANDSPDHRPLVVDQGGIEAVTYALRHHCSDPEVIRSCCRAMISFTAASPEHRLRAIAAGADRAICEAVEGSRSFSCDPDLDGIMSYALRCLGQGAGEHSQKGLSTPPGYPPEFRVTARAT